MTDLSEKLQKLVSEFGSTCKRKKLTINVYKSKVIWFSSAEEQVNWDISLNEENLVEVSHKMGRRQKF